MEWNKYVVGGAAFGAIAGLWRQIKAAVWRICNLVLQEVEIRDPVMAAAVVGYLVTRHKPLGLYTRTYSAANDHHVRNGQRRFGCIAFERYGTQTLIFRRGWAPLFFRGSGGGIMPPEIQAANQKQSSASQSTAARLLWVRGTFDVDQLISDAVHEWNQIGWEHSDSGPGGRKRFFIKYLPDPARGKGGDGGSGATSSWQHFTNIRLLDVKPLDVGLGAQKSGSMLERLFFPDDVRALIEEVKLWRKSQEWYQARGIPWKRGWLLFGKPGTGKTALAGAFAYDLDMPIFVFNLVEMGNTDFMSEWKNMLASVPCIALIEDMDAVFHGRENISRREQSPEHSQEGGGFRRGPRGGLGGDGLDGNRGNHGGLSFDVLLNCIDGVDRAEGVFTIITTNHVEWIDPALGQPSRRSDGGYEVASTRPGRIDRAVELTHLKGYVKKRMARHILGEFPRACDEMMRHVDAHPEEIETPAQFQQRCNQIALACYWKLGERPADEEKPALSLVPDGTDG